jgi:predicted aspartyl protease
MDGTLQGNSSPRIKIEIYGAWGRQNPPVLFEAIVDTGFTGGISIPITQALPLGLTLFSTATFTLADNSKENTFLCIGMARLESEERPMVFSLTKGNDILVGTDFLSAFNAKLELDYKSKTFSVVPRQPEEKSKANKETGKG